VSRTDITRLREKGSTDRAALDALLDSCILGHFGLADDDGRPVVIPTAVVRAGDRVLVLGPGTIGLLTALFLRAAGAEVHLLGNTCESLAFARELGFAHAWQADELPDVSFDAVVDAANSAELPARALDMVEPSGRLVYIGLAGRPSHIDTRVLALKDVTAVGILSGSPGLRAAITAYADGAVDPRPLVAATVGLDAVRDVLAGVRPVDAGAGPKIHIDPRQR